MNANEYNEMTNDKTDLMQDETVVRAAANLLKDNANHLNAVTLQRLEAARSAAVNRLAAKQASGSNLNGGVLTWFGHSFGSYFEQHKMLSSAMIVGAILLTFFAARQLNNNEGSTGQIYQGDSDAFLLASELPPEAFADKGFDTWLVSKRD